MFPENPGKMMAEKKTDTERIAELRKKVEDLEKQMEEVQKEFRKSKVKVG
jgi:hypothetical protein